MEKVLYIIGGANGSGKTTIAKELLKNIKLEFVNADEIAKDISPQSLEKARVQAGKIAINKINKLIEQQKSFCIESTLSGNFLVKIIKKAKEFNYKIKLIYVFLESYNECITRVKTRVIKGGHNVEENEIIRRYSRSKNNFWFLYKDIVNEYEVYYNNCEYPVLVFKTNLEIYENELFIKFKKDLKNE
ncbi:MAG TPA: zeta toxin family protein [Rickettsiales bacterium]|nr:zeta toxin family protein [Rickettsiales bacterium]